MFAAWEGPLLSRQTLGEETRVTVEKIYFTTRMQIQRGVRKRGEREPESLVSVQTLSVCVIARCLMAENVIWLFGSNEHTILW